MPTYEYECAKCGHAFERFQSMTAEPVKSCPQCRARRVRRILSGGAGVIFKGSGFYQTDYRSEGYRRAAKADQSSGASAPAVPAAPAAAASEGAKPAKPEAAAKKPATKSSGSADS